jgi:hypothetical protein
MSILVKLIHREEDGDASLYLVVQNSEGDIVARWEATGTIEECVDIARSDEIDTTEKPLVVV